MVMGTHITGRGGTVHVFVSNRHGTDLLVRCMRSYDEYRQFTPQSKMAPSMAAVLRAPRKLCSFSYVLFVILLFYVLDVVSITVYDRHTLLNNGSFELVCVVFRIVEAPYSFL